MGDLCKDYFLEWEKNTGGRRRMELVGEERSLRKMGDGAAEEYEGKRTKVL